MESNNVIAFPKSNKNIKKGVSVDEINFNVEQMHLYHVQETIANIIPLIFTQLEIAGFYQDDETIENEIRDSALFVESLRSMLFKHYGIYHPFQKVSEEVFEKELTKEGALKIVDQLIVDLKEEKEE